MRNHRQSPGSPPRRRPLVVTADPHLREAVSAVAALADVSLDHARGAAQGRGAWRTAPLVLVGDDVAADLARAALPRRDGVVLLGRDLDDGSIWQRGSALGAGQVLFLPDAEQWLAGLLADAGGAEPGPRGPILAVLGGRGGAGASTLAAALALTATRAGHRATLVDLDPIGGGIDLLFGLEGAPGPRWSELAGWRDHSLCGRSLREALPSYATRGAPAALSLDPEARNLPILTWPRARADEPFGPVEPEAARSVLQALAQANDVVVVDLPRALDEAAVEALSVAAVTLLVVPAEVRAASAASRLAAAIRLITPDLRAVVRMPSPGDLVPGELADVVGLPLAGVIGPDKRASVAAEHGEPPGEVPRGTLPGFCRPFLEQLMGTRRPAVLPKWNRRDFKAAA